MNSAVSAASSMAVFIPFTSLNSLNWLNVESGYHIAAFNIRNGLSDNVPGHIVVAAPANPAIGRIANNHIACANCLPPSAFGVPKRANPP